MSLIARGSYPSDGPDRYYIGQDKPAVISYRESLGDWPGKLYSRQELIMMGEADFSAYFDYDREDNHGSTDIEQADA